MKFYYFIDQFLKFFKREDLGFSSQASVLIDLNLDLDSHDYLESTAFSFLTST